MVLGYVFFNPTSAGSVSRVGLSSIADVVESGFGRNSEVNRREDGMMHH